MGILGNSQQTQWQSSGDTVGILIGHGGNPQATQWEFRRRHRRRRPRRRRAQTKISSTDIHGARIQFQVSRQHHVMRTIVTQLARNNKLSRAC